MFSWFQVHIIEQKTGNNIRELSQQTDTNYNYTCICLFWLHWMKYSQGIPISSESKQTHHLLYISMFITTFCTIMKMYLSSVQCDSSPSSSCFSKNLQYLSPTSICTYKISFYCYWFQTGISFPLVTTEVTESRLALRQIGSVNYSKCILFLRV